MNRKKRHVVAKPESIKDAPEALRYDISLNILGYQEEGEWVALALEMDLRGYGDSFREAIADLRDLVIMQIGFALFKGQPDMILKPADPTWFQIYAERRRDWLSSVSVGGSSAREDYQIAGLPIPPPHIIAKQQEDRCLDLIGGQESSDAGPTSPKRREDASVD